MVSTTTPGQDDRCGRRAGTDRRLRDEPIDHDERRRAERRSGDDRRNQPRH